MPKVSVVIPNYNHARFLRRRIDTVLGQTYQNFEVILMDDRSTDESRSILSEYAADPRVRLEFNEENSGSTFKQWNKGVRLARGKYVWIAESDDYADERMLGRLVATLNQDSEIAFAYCRSWCVTTDDRVDGFADSYLLELDQRWTTDYCANGSDECRKYLLRCNTVPNASAALFRKARYEQVGGADESLRICGDWKLWASLAFAGKVAYLAEPLNYFRFHNESVRNRSARLGLLSLESFYVIRWMLNEAKPEYNQREEVCERLAMHWVPALMSTHVPLGLKYRLLRDAIATDPDCIRHAAGPALMTLRLKFARHCRFFRATP